MTKKEYKELSDALSFLHIQIIESIQKDSYELQSTFTDYFEEFNNNLKKINETLH
jgi:hypothetical protein